ncbi:MAG TPA: sulfotransferase family protein [Verrucomicrobiae bacterium]|nr:sulfotransferase family protein [Verrucomicrobiae bacterium]
MDLTTPTAEQLEDWIPIRLYWAGTEPMVDWCWLGDLRFTDPFFDQTVARAFRRPFSLLFRHQTSLDVLEQMGKGVEPPAGFIFHASRCGSTLVSQMLAAVESNIVISEAPPIDFVLRSTADGKAIADEQRVQWLRWLIGVLGRSRGRAVRSYIKFDSWHVLHLPLLRRAFPDVPWIFIYREPLEILVSHQQQPGSQMVPGTLDPRPFGIDPSGLREMPSDEYGARILAGIFEAAGIHARSDGGVLINYTQLPEAVWSLFPQIFRGNHEGDDIERMQNAARFHAKNPSLNFEPDSAQKREQAGDRLAQLARQWLQVPYESLEVLRQGQSRNGASGGCGADGLS